MARMAHARGMVVAVLATGLWAAGHGRVSAQADAAAPRLTLQRLVDPATRVSVQGRLVRPALHALIRFDTLGELFDHIDQREHQIMNELWVLVIKILANTEGIIRNWLAHPQNTNIGGRFVSL